LTDLKGFAAAMGMIQSGHGGSMTITPELKQAVERSGEEPVRIEDPETHQRYVVVREEVYEHLQSLVGLEMGEITVDEQKTALARLGQSVGWDDPAMDVYNDL
jgi:hypothetical protein